MPSSKCDRPSRGNPQNLSTAPAIVSNPTMRTSCERRLERTELLRAGAMPGDSTEATCRGQTSADRAASRIQAVPRETTLTCGRAGGREDDSFHEHGTCPARLWFCYDS